jgi:hypothetical protein
MKLINRKEVIELPTPIRVAFNPMDQAINSLPQPIDVSGLDFNKRFEIRVEGSVTWGK